MSTQCQTRSFSPWDCYTTLIILFNFIHFDSYPVSKIIVTLLDMCYWIHPPYIMYMYSLFYTFTHRLYTFWLPFYFAFVSDQEKFKFRYAGQIVSADLLYISIHLSYPLTKRSRYHYQLSSNSDLLL